ncbi:MAG: SMI1/KNR4 family protein [Deltaproteobacteria bacterium]|nr:SMI1/KNR4 family protein [Deltaproteobacteria bacterium]
MEPLAVALNRLARALQAQAGGRVRLKPFLAARGGCLKGVFEVRAADGRVRRLQDAELPLPAPLGRAYAHLAPVENVAIDLGSHALTLWAPQELIELQVGFRWHGFNGRRMREWDERYVVFAEDGGDPVALRSDELEGPVWLSHRGEGRHAFFEAAPDLGAFYEAVAIWLEAGDLAGLHAGLEARFGGETASRLWIWRQLISGEEARR